MARGEARVQHSRVPQKTPIFRIVPAILAGFAAGLCPSAMATRIVDFGSSWGVGFYRDVTATTMTGVDVDGDGSTSTDKVRAWPFRLDVPLSPSGSTYDNQFPSAKFYGGLYAAVPVASGTTSVLSEGHINQNHELRDDWNLMCLPTTAGSPELDSYEAAGIWLWKKEDFLNGASDPARTVSFSSPSDYVAIFISRYFGGVHWGRWVIQNGSQFYISESTFANRTTPITASSPSGTTTGVLKTAHTIKPAEIRWAPYDPTGGGTNLTNPRGMRFNWTASPDYQYRTFDNVQAVGFLIQRDLSVGEAAASALSMKEPIAVKWNAVQVAATVSNPPAGSPYIDLAQVGGTSGQPQIWASRTEITYRKWAEIFRWAESNQRARNFSDGVNRDLPPYSFDRDGAIGSSEAVLAASHSPEEPVASITWYDAAVWCNALSELEGLEPAYYTDAAYTVPFREVFDRTLTAQRDVRPKIYWKTSAAGYRLPTETEWKGLCAEAGTGSASWTASNSGGKTQPAGTLAANSLGLNDLVGNVAEFIWDDSGAISDPATRTTRKVMGGSFRYPADENATSLIPSGEKPWNGSPSIGFRPVRNGTGGLSGGGASAPERTITSTLDIPPDPSVAQTEEALRILVRSQMPLNEIAGAGTLAPGSTYTAPVTTSAYDIEVGRVEVSYRIWLRVRQWAERSLGYRFNYPGDMGSARWNLPLSRNPDEPVTNISWVDTLVWCNALSELMQLDPVYRSAGGAVERTASAFRLNTYEYYGYPNTGNVIGRQVDDAILVDLLPDPIRTGYRIPTRTEAEAYGLTVYTQTNSSNYSTNALGWFSDDLSFGGNRTLLKAMPVGTKGTDPAHNNLSDILGNVREWCFNGDSLFGPYVIGNDVGYAKNAYPLTMNRNEYRFEGRPTIGFRVMKIQGEGNVPPNFEADPLLRSEAYAGLPYSATIAGSATDPNPGDTITYSKAAGPSWLSVSGNGSLSGTPGASDVGTQTFQVTATDFGGLSTTVSLRIEVRDSALAPAISPASGTFEGRIDISLTTATPGCSFFYTTDGSEPTPSHGSATAGNFTVLPPAGSLTLRAIAVHPSLGASLTSSATFTVTPGQAPAITLDPQSQTAGTGTGITLSAGASGTGPLLYQWLKDGQPIPGATSPTFSISSAATSSTGYYSVAVSNDFGSATSSPAEIVIIDGYSGSSPDVGVQPAPVQVEVLPGSSAQFTFAISNSGGSALDWSLVSPASGSGGNYALSRSTSGGPAMAWRNNVGTANGGTQISFTDIDDSLTAIAFPGGFSFPFYGTPYTSAYVCTNGFLAFASTTSFYTNATIPSSSAPLKSIAVLWDDLIVDTSAGVWWRKDADAMVITWNNVRTYSSNSTRQTFQALLFPDGTIRCNYQTLASVVTATVGIQNTATTGLLVGYNSYSTAVTGEALTFAPSVSWLTSAAPLSGSVGSLGQTLVTLTANATGLSAGETRTSQLTLTSNDPDTPTLTIPVELSVVSSYGAPAVVTPSALPGALAGKAYATKLQHRSGNGTATWSLSAGSLPQGLALATDGWISGTPTLAGNYSFTALVTDSAGATASRQFTLAVTRALAPAITTAALPGGQVLSAYSATLAAKNGQAPLAWSAAGPLPAGLLLNPAGVLSGTPQEDGTFDVWVRVTDAAGQFSDAHFAMVVQPPEALAISTATLTGGVLDTPYQAQLSSSGGYGGNSWAVSGLLPAGLTFTQAGLLSGTPSSAGISTLHFTVTDRKGNTASRDLGLVISATIPGRPAVEAGGWNLHDVAYWDQANMFADLMKSASIWQHNWIDYAYATDAQGYPTTIPAGNIPGAKVTLHEPGQYVLTWRGNGTVRVESATLVSETLTGTVKRRVYEKTTPATDEILTRVQILGEVPATDIHLWAPGTEPAATTSVFHPAFLARIKDNSAVIRFMDWGGINASTHPSWASRRKADYYTQDSPTSYEYMIALCNAADKDMWVCIPHTSLDEDPDYAAKLARLILTGTDGGTQVCEPLKPGLKVYVEWSNEVWNSSFPQFTWAADKAKARLGVTTLPNYNEVWKIIGEYHAKTFKAFRDEFAAAGRPASQLVRVLATQIGGGLASLHMQGIETIAATNSAAAGDYQPDAMAVGAYFGHDLDDWVVENVASPGSASAADYAAAFAALEDSIRTTYASSLQNSAQAASSLGLALVAYEGGQHIVGSGSNASNSGLTQFLTAMNRDARMGPLVTLDLDIWEQAGGGLFMAFQETGPFGSFGSWGFREYWYQTLSEAPKAAAFTDWMRRMQQSHLRSYEIPEGQLGYSYSETLDIVTRTAPITCSVAAGSLPPGLALSSNGSISGVPLDFGDFGFSVQLSDGAGQTDTRAYNLAITTARPATVLSPAADTHVYSLAGSTTTNYGNSTTLATHTQSLRYSYLRWDLGAFAGKRISRATLQLNRTGSSTATAATITAYSPESAWDELGITWASGRPSLGTTITTFPVAAATTAYSIDLTAWANARAGSGVAGFALLTDQYAAWASKEAASGGPKLTIETEPDTEITTYWTRWSQDHFGADSAAPNEDPDGDGISNLAEYALGSDPSTANFSGNPGLVDDGSGPHFRLPFHPGQRNRRVRVTASTDLQSWNTVLFDSDSYTETSPFEWQTLDLDISGLVGTSHPKMFFRVEIQLQP